MNDFKTRIYIILIFLLLMVMFLLVITMNIRLGDYSKIFYWGLLIGILPGLATWLHLYDTWDPENLRPKNENTKTLDPKWISLVVVSGIIASRAFEQQLPAVAYQLITGVFVSWFFMGAGYFVVQLWRYR